MDKHSKNIIMITAGGVGQRFGSNTPKQYLLINGVPVIEYVIKACKLSKKADAILVVADPLYHEQLRRNYNVDVATNGSELNQTKRNGFDYIREHSSCEKLVVVEAVRPSLTPEAIDVTFDKLNDYDAVACARKVTDSLGHYGEWIVNREDYYTLNPPEGFRFALIDKCFNSMSKLTESIQQLPETTRVYLNFDVPYFDKITYPEDLLKAEAIIKSTKWDERNEI